MFWKHVSSALSIVKISTSDFEVFRVIWLSDLHMTTMSTSGCDGSQQFSAVLWKPLCQGLRSEFSSSHLDGWLAIIFSSVPLWKLMQYTDHSPPSVDFSFSYGTAWWWLSAITAGTNFVLAVVEYLEENGQGIDCQVFHQFCRVIVCLADSPGFSCMSEYWSLVMV